MTIGSPAERLRLPADHHGPDRVGHGGVTAGALAAHLPDGPVEVRLERAAPLGVDLTVEVDGDRARLLDGDEQIASARVAERSDGQAPAFVPLDVAHAVHGGMRASNPFPSCFGCGHDRDGGLRIEPGRHPDGGRVTGVFDPGRAPRDTVFAEAGVRLGSVYVWAALDCPGAFAIIAAEGATAILTAALTVEILAPVPRDAQTVVVGRVDGRDGRKIRASTALWSADGRLLAHARQLWIETDGSG